MKSSHGENIHKSLRFLFVIAQIFGFFPIRGVFDAIPRSLKWFSIGILSSAVTSIGGILVALGHVRHMSIYGYDQFEMNGIIFYVCGSLSCIYFIKLANDWKDIVLKWEKVDKSMFSYGWPKQLNCRIRTIATIFLLFEAAEHFVIQANKLIVAVRCEDSFTKGLTHDLVNMSFPVIFDVIKPYYSAWLGIIFQVVNTRMAFSWTFIDLFIILISCAVAARFRQVNCKIRSLRDMKVRSEETWGTINEDYNRLCILCSFLDDKLSYLILISFFNNFYFIIFQIFQSLHFRGTPTLETIYYFISLFLLLLRLTCLCLFGSLIHDESRKPIDILSSVPNEVYNQEIIRFINTLKYQTVSFTGKKFFPIKKNLLLKIASAIVTYELVVIQFNGNGNKKYERSKNSIC